jgi:hypothetical protein
LNHALGLRGNVGPGVTAFDVAPRPPPPFGFASVERKKVVAAFDGGRITSNGGVMLLGAVERQLGIADALASMIATRAIR